MSQCPHCKLREGQEAVKYCEREQCGLSLTLKGPDRFKRKMRAQLAQLITADVLYQAYTGEEDIYKLDKLRSRWIEDPVITAASAKWPQRLADLDARRKREMEENHKAVKQYTLGIF